MLSLRQKEGFRRILQPLNDDILLSLCRTVTKGQVEVTGRTEAISVIVRYTERAVDLLRRRKITRDRLFQYLASEGVVVMPSAEKYDIIKKVLEHWGYHDAVDFDDENDIDDDLPTATLSDQPQTGGSAPSETSNYYMELARAFLTWYFMVLNAQNPDTNNNANNCEFGPQHFYDGVKLSIRTLKNDGNLTEDVHGTFGVYTKLLNFVKIDRLLFNPNVDDGCIQVESEVHGVVMIVCCGTVHRVGELLGLFEQATYIIRDPVVKNNWKIKELKLNLRPHNDMSRQAIDQSQRLPIT